MIKKILIVEDEVLISEHLKRIVQNLGYEALDLCADYEQLLKVLETEQPDIAFLDIRMNGQDDGFLVAKKMREKQIPFIFITSFSDKETLRKAIGLKPLGYVLKPFSKEDIRDQLDFLVTELAEQFITLGTASDMKRLAINEILWLRSENVYVEVQCKDKKYVFREKLQILHDSLPPQLFVRVGQSHVVNLTHVNSASKTTITIGQEEIPLSVKYKKAFFEKFSEV